MITTPVFSHAVATAAAVTATFVAATACGASTEAPMNIYPRDKERSTQEAYPADGRENRNSASTGPTTRDYPADGRENRNGGIATREYRADGRENRNSGPATGEHKTPPE